MTMLAELARLFYDRYDKGSDKTQRDQIIFYAILAEAKINNDLASIIGRSKKENLIKEFPGVFEKFSTTMADLLLAIGVPAKDIFKENKIPKEDVISEMGKSGKTYNFYEKKTASELFEFYSRKCVVLKSLYLSDALSISSVKLVDRVKNIEYATKALIVKLEKIHN